MKKVIFLCLILLIICLTIVIVFCFLEISKIKNSQVHSFTRDSGTSSVEKASLSDSKNTVSILFVGDMMFDRWIRQVIETKGANFIFQNVRDLLRSEDLVIGNLEGPITNNSSVSLTSEMGSRENYIFTFSPEIARNLYAENIHIVNIGNNHILNFGENGLAETKKYLTEAGVDFFGNVGNISERFFVKDVKGVKIAFVNYNQFVSKEEKDVSRDLQEVKKMKPDFVIVYTHWGIEFMDKPSERDEELAHMFIDNGADLVIGSHPHVIQTKEEYNGKMIYYSLGNFIFDQYFNPNTQRGLTVEVKVDSKGKSSFKEYEVEMKKDGQTILVNNELEKK